MPELFRIFLLAFGVLMVALGVVGVFLPLLPTTPFLILAALCFDRSSPKFHGWLLGHRLFGPLVLDWQKHRAIRLRYKILATVMMMGSALLVFTHPRIPPAGVISFSIFSIGLLGFLWTRKTKRT